jgi:hypothetical protein
MPIAKPTKTYAIQNDRLDFFDADGLPLAGTALYDKAIAEAGNRILLAFSAGKDSLAAWLALLEDGRFDIVPYYLDWIPGGWSWSHEMLAYYESYFGCKIYRMPHPYLYEQIDRAAFQPPDRVQRINTLDLPTFTFADVDNLVAKAAGLSAPFVAIGMRAADNLERRRMILQQGSLGIKRRRYFYPVWDWKIQDVIDIIMRHNVKISPEYAIWGRTPVSFNYDYMAPLRDNFSDDWEKLRQWFPMIDLQCYRYEVLNNGN